MISNAYTMIKMFNAMNYIPLYTYTTIVNCCYLNAI